MLYSHDNHLRPPAAFLLALIHSHRLPLGWPYMFILFSLAGHHHPHEFIIIDEPISVQICLFDHLIHLMTKVEPFSRARCGWTQRERNVTHQGQFFAKTPQKGAQPNTKGPGQTKWTQSSLPCTMDRNHTKCLSHRPRRWIR